jgi:hypothetical protein
MKKKIAIFASVLGALAVAALIRWGQISFESSGGGRGAESPNKKLMVMASAFHNKKFWSGWHRYYEFTVGPPKGKPIQHIIMDQPLQDLIDWREDGSIDWAADGSFVTYAFKDTRLVLSVNP